MSNNGKDISSFEKASSFEEGRNMLCIFNPEHDLCLAHSGVHYIPPQSALHFATDCKDIMKLLYGEEVVVVDAAHLPSYSLLKPSVIIPWGWNTTLRQQLLSAGYPEALMLPLQQITDIRRLQKRTTTQQCLTWLAQQTGSLYPIYIIVDNASKESDLPEKISQSASLPAGVPVENLPQLLERNGRLVLKAPWSGSGRGLRWLDGRIREKDIEWLLHILKQQGCVIAEPWLEVLQDFAMEFVLDDDVRFVGYSLFSTKAGVYQCNMLLTDKAIEQRLEEYIPSSWIRHIRLLLIYWLRQHVLPFYHGPLGVDMYIHSSPRGPRLRPCSEINFRHTMGLVAHKYLSSHLQDEGKLFAIEHAPSSYRYFCQ